MASFRTCAVLLALAGASLHARAAAPPPPPAAPVRLTDAGDHVSLGNGVVSLEVAKANGDLRSLTFAGRSILAAPGYLDWISGGNQHLARADFSILTDPRTNGGDLAEIRIAEKYPGSGPSPFDVELHYILRRGDSGPYVFAVFSHPKEYPAGGFAQSRWVLRLNDQVFDFINVDERRRHLMPPSNTPTKQLGPKESMMFTDGPFKGQITDKYHYFVDAGDHFVHGWSGTRSHLGCWILYGSTEDQNGGPTKQHNAAHFGRLLFKILSCGHYGAAGVNVAAGEEWRKVYGPWMLYLNQGSDNDALWADAQKKAAAERAAFPPAWMHHPAFPAAAQRGAVTGRLHLVDPQDPAASPANAWVGLALPAPDWQKQSDGYQFWVRADRDGRFTIPHVRPGAYTLYAFVDGVMDEFRRDGITVAAGAPQDVGTLEWKPLRLGRQLWQIGTPDRTSREFRRGDDPRQWGLWQKFPEDFPRGVNFIVGQSRERDDWNYAQVNVQKDGQWVGTTWNIGFDLPAATGPGTAALRLAFASTNNARLIVTVNGRPVDRFSTSVWGADNAMIRASNHGQYTEYDVFFDAALLQAGRNTIALEQTAGGNAQKSVMYDCLRLELDDGHPFDKTKLPPARRNAAPAAAAPEPEPAD